MADKFFDPPQIRAGARDLDRIAGDVDEAGRTMPETLDAGPLTPWVLNLVDACAANVAAQVIRLHAAADAARAAADRYETTEHHNVTTVAGFLRDLSGDDSASGK